MKKIGSVLSIILLLAVVALKFVHGQEFLVETSVLIMVMFLVMLLFEVFPIMLVCIITLSLMPILKVTETFNGALTGFSNQVVFFIFASFGLAMGLIKTPLPRRILKVMMKKSGDSTPKLVFVFMIVTALTSTVISNVPTCAVYLSIASEFLKILSGDEKRKMGKTLMIAIPVASMIGGVITPAGSSINILAISLLEKASGETIAFIQWTIIGILIAAVILPIAAAIIIKVFPPINIDKNKLDGFINELDVPEKLTTDEKRVMSVFAVMLVFWISSSWVPAINIMLVAMAGCCVFCFPKFGVISVNELVKNMSWDSFFLLGTVLSMSDVLVKNGVNDILAKAFPSTVLPPVLALCLIALMTFLFLIIIPVAPSLLVILIPIVMNIASLSNVPVTLAVMCSAVCAGNCYLFPIDTVCLLSYEKGYYRMFEMSKATLFIQLSIVGVVPLIMCFCGMKFF